MSKNDIKIKALLEKIDLQKEKLGEKPKGLWKTNGILKVLGANYSVNSVNINTINSINMCIELVTKVLLERSHCIEAHKFLEVPEGASTRGLELNDMLDDIKLRSKMIKWDSEKKKLERLESQLKDLRSEDAKTEDSLADIAKSLGL